MSSVALASWGAFAIAMRRRGGLGVGRGVAALRRKLAGSRERAEVDRGLQHLTLVAQAGQVDREGHRPHQHHDQQRRDDHHGPALVVQPLLDQAADATDLPRRLRHH